MREYAVDQLEAAFVREVMDADICTVEPERGVAELYEALPEGSRERRQRLHPVLSARGALAGVLPWSRVLANRAVAGLQVRDAMIDPVAVAYPDEILRPVAERMAAHGLGAMPVVSRSDHHQLEGIITLFDLMQAREKLLTEERHAEKVLTLRRVAARRVTAGSGRAAR